MYMYSHVHITKDTKLWANYTQVVIRGKQEDERGISAQVEILVP